MYIQCNVYKPTYMYIQCNVYIILYTHTKMYADRHIDRHTDTDRQTETRLPYLSKQPFHSCTYFHNAPNSLISIVPFLL